MGTGREIEELDERLAKIVHAVDQGRANWTDVRRELASIRDQEVAEIDRLSRRVKRDLND